MSCRIRTEPHTSHPNIRSLSCDSPSLTPQIPRCQRRRQGGSLLSFQSRVRTPPRLTARCTARPPYTRPSGLVLSLPHSATRSVRSHGRLRRNPRSDCIPHPTFLVLAPCGDFILPCVLHPASHVCGGPLFGSLFPYFLYALYPPGNLPSRPPQTSMPGCSRLTPQSVVPNRVTLCSYSLIS